VPVRSRFDAASSAQEVAAGCDLSGRRALVTGGASGIGREIAHALAAAGADILIADVDREQGESAAAAVAAATGNRAVRFAALDLGSLAAVRDFAAGLRDRGAGLDILINNAGVMACPLAYTVDGHERQFAVNYLGHFLLALLLAPALERAAPSRLVSVSSIAHRRADIDFDDIDFRTRPYERWEAYGQSKTACALLAIAYTERMAARGITCNAVNPGGSMTGLHRHLTGEEMRALGWLDERGRPPARWRTPAQCAATSVWAATTPELVGIGGLYLEECREAEPWQSDRPMAGVRNYARDPARARRLWEVSLGLTAGFRAAGEE